jgi:hypothetical protein
MLTKNLPEEHGHLAITCHEPRDDIAHPNANTYYKHFSFHINYEAVRYLPSNYAY